MSTAAARRERAEAIVDATRRLFDERGMQDAAVEDIAREVGINKALIYRHFTSKEELYVLTLTRYLDELTARLEAADGGGSPSERLRRISEAYVDFGLQYPAFLDCALEIMRRPFAELSESVSQAVLFQLGQSMAACLNQLRGALDAGMQAGEFAVADPDTAANLLYAQGLGTMQLARVGIAVRPAQNGFPQTFPVAAEAVRSAVVDGALALVKLRR